MRFQQGMYYNPSPLSLSLLSLSLSLSLSLCSLLSPVRGLFFLPLLLGNNLKLSGYDCRTLSDYFGGLTSLGLTLPHHRATKGCVQSPFRAIFYIFHLEEGVVAIGLPKTLAAFCKSITSSSFSTSSTPPTLAG